MPLSAAVDREHIHTREIECRGYRRADGLWDIEGHLTDVKTYPFTNDERGSIEPGDPVHDMWMRLTIDSDFTIVGVEAVTDKSPYAICGAITSAFGQLVGINIARGFTREVRRRLGGVHGCTHLVEMLRPIATTAFQTIFPILMRERGIAAAHLDPTSPDKPAKKPPLLNTCHAFASDGELVRRHWPAFYTGEEADTDRRAAG